MTKSTSRYPVRHARRRLRRLVWLVCISAAFALVGCEDESADESPPPGASAGSAQSSTSGSDDDRTESASGAPDRDRRARERGSQSGGAIETVSLDAIAFEASSDWTQRPPSNRMRKAEFVLSAPADSDVEDATLVVFRFPGGAGPREANIKRWLGQFKGPDGAPMSKDDAEIETLDVGGLTITTVDVSGRYVAAMRPGAERRHDETGWRMFAAIVEGAGDAYYFKATGPEATLDAHDDALEHMVQSMRKNQ